MEKLHKQNLIIVWCSIIALSLVSLMGYGFTVLAIRGIAILVVAGIISTIGCYLSIDDVKKVLIIVFPPAIGTLLYSWVYGGNSIPYLANFVLLAMTTSYFYGVGYHLFRSAVCRYFGRIHGFQPRDHRGN